METRRYAGGGDVQTKIDKLQKLIDNPKTPETDKENFRNALEQFKEKLKSEKPKVSKPKATPVAKPRTTPTARQKVVSRAKPTTARAKAKATPTARPKTVAKARTTATATAKPKTTTARPKVVSKAKPTATEKKMPKGVQLISKKKVVVDGKQLSVDSKEFCDYLTAEFVKRKETAQSKKGSRKKTKSVMALVSDKIEKGVEKAIKTGISKQKPALRTNPNVFIGKVQKLETATKNFLQQLKEVLGNEYDAKEVTDTTKAIHKLIEDLKKKYTKK